MRTPTDDRPRAPYWEPPTPPLEDGPYSRNGDRHPLPLRSGPPSERSSHDWSNSGAPSRQQFEHSQSISSSSRSHNHSASTHLPSRDRTYDRYSREGYDRDAGGSSLPPPPPSYMAGYHSRTSTAGGYSNGTSRGEHSQYGNPQPYVASTNGYHSGPAPYDHGHTNGYNNGISTPASYTGPEGIPIYDSMDERPARRRRGNLPKWATDCLKQWFYEHVAHPYPTEQEKQELCKLTGLGMTQLSNWFINARRRQNPVLHAQAQAETMIREGSGGHGGSNMEGTTNGHR